MNNLFYLLKTQIESASKAYPVKNIVQCGSSAKGTSLDNSDIDIFIQFIPDYDIEKFPPYIYYLAEKLFNNECEIKYATFPYIETRVNDVLINIVPCRYTESIAEIKSPVDRTPHHVTWVNTHLNIKQKNDVKKLKEFLKLNNIYGADNETKGFSGYICEVLIYKYKTFDNLIKHFALTKRSNINKSPYYITDPIDISRKLSTAISNKSWIKFILACREHLKYDPPQTTSIPVKDLHELLNNHILLVHQPYEELAKVRKETKKVVKLLVKNGYNIYDYDSQPQLSIILLENKTLPKVYVKNNIINITSKNAYNNIGKINGSNTLKIILNDDFTISALKFRNDVKITDVLKDYIIVPNNLRDYGYKKYLSNLNI